MFVSQGSEIITIFTSLNILDQVNIKYYMYTCLNIPVITQLGYKLTNKLCSFRKYPYSPPPPMEGFCFAPPSLQEIPVKLYFASKMLPFKTPLPLLGISEMIIYGVGMGFFWNCEKCTEQRACKSNIFLFTEHNI